MFVGFILDRSNFCTFSVFNIMILISINKDDIKPKNGLHIEEYKYSKDYLYKGYYEND